MACVKCLRPLPKGSAFCCWCGADQTAEPSKKVKRHRGHGQGSVTKNKNCPNAPYYARVSVGGKRVSVGYFATTKEANQAIAEYIANWSEETSPRIEWTLRRFFDTWSERVFPTLTKSGANAHRASWKYMIGIADRKMRELKTADYQSCVDIAVSEGKSRAVCEKIRNLASLLCQEAMRDDVIDKNYARLLELPKSDKREKDIFTQQEIALITEHDDDPEARIILILIYTGLRIGEFLKLRRCDIDEEQWLLKGGSKTAAGRNRTVPIVPKIRPYFEVLVATAASDESKLLEIGEKRYRDKYFYEYLVELGILTQEETEVGGKPRLTPHSCRHTFASLAREAGVDKDILTRVIGHTDYSTTDENYVSINAQIISSEIAKSKEYKI